MGSQSQTRLSDWTELNLEIILKSKPILSFFIPIKLEITVSPHKLILLPVVLIPFWLSSEVWSIVYRIFPKTCKYISTLKPLRLHFNILVYSAPCLFSPSQFSLWKEISVFQNFSPLSCIYYSWVPAERTQIMIFVLLKVNRHFSIIISLGGHFLATALMDSPSFSKLHFPAPSGHQSILICHVPLWTPFEVSLILFPTGRHISVWVPWRFSLVSILLWNLLWVCVLVKLHLF